MRITSAADEVFVNQMVISCLVFPKIAQKRASGKLLWNESEFPELPCFGLVNISMADTTKYLSLQKVQHTTQNNRLNRKPANFQS